MTGVPDANSSMRELLAIMVRLRAADGCPWDREQSFASIAPYTIEEAYEVADAVERGDMPTSRTSSVTCCFRWCFMRKSRASRIISISRR